MDEALCPLHVLTSFLCTYLYCVLGCDKKFSRPDSLTTHTKTHSNIRPYVCTVEGCPKAYYHARSLKKHELAHESKQGNGALRGAGAVHGAVPISSLDKAGDAISLSGPTGPQQQHRTHFNHPYHMDFPGVSRLKHRRHLSQGAINAANIVHGVSALSPPALPPVSAAYTAQPQLGPVSDPSLGLVVSPIGANPPVNGSPNAVSMAGVAGAGFGSTMNGYPALLTPALSTHSSTSSVQTLSMVMGNAPVATDGGVVMMDPMYQAQSNLVSDGPQQTMTPSGSPAFQPAAPTAILRSPTPTAVSMNMPMSMTMAVSGISHPHITTTMLPTMVVPAPILNMTMVQDAGPGGALYMVSNDPHAGIMPSSMNTTTLVSQPGAELGYGPMPVDPQQM